jgi:hypothetical protein
MCVIWHITFQFSVFCLCCEFVNIGIFLFSNAKQNWSMINEVQLPLHKYANDLVKVKDILNYCIQVLFLGKYSVLFKSYHCDTLYEFPFPNCTRAISPFQHWKYICATGSARTLFNKHNKNIYFMADNLRTLLISGEKGSADLRNFCRGV